MNKIIRIAALSMAVCALGTVCLGCGSEEYSEHFDSITESCKMAFEVTKGEIVIDENILVDKAVEGVLENSSSYTYIQYDNGSPATFKYVKESDDSTYELMKDERGTFEAKDGVFDPNEYTGEIPDFAEYLDVDFTLEDVKKITVEFGAKGTKIYTVTMVKFYADNFDADMNGGKYDCFEVIYVYTIDSLKRLKTVESEYAAEFTYNGETVTTVRQETVTFEAMDVK